MRTHVVVIDKGRTIRADYAGGAYIELTFGSTAFKPTEVVNVWSYETGKASIPHTKEAMRNEVLEWIETSDIEWPEWYEGYLENARY